MAASPRRSWPDGSQVQSIAFPKHVWTKADARAWLVAHKFTAPAAEETAHFYRYQQRSPKLFPSYGTITREHAGKPIELIVGVRRKNPGSKTTKQKARAFEVERGREIGGGRWDEAEAKRQSRMRRDAGNVSVTGIPPYHVRGTAPDDPTGSGDVFNRRLVKVAGEPQGYGANWREPEFPWLAPLREQRRSRAKARLDETRRQPKPKLPNPASDDVVGRFHALEPGDAIRFKIEKHPRKWFDGVVETVDRRASGPASAALRALIKGNTPKPGAYGIMQPASWGPVVIEWNYSAWPARSPSPVTAIEWQAPARRPAAPRLPNVAVGPFGLHPFLVVAREKGKRKRHEWVRFYPDAESARATSPDLAEQGFEVLSARKLSQGEWERVERGDPLRKTNPARLRITNPSDDDALVATDAVASVPAGEQRARLRALFGKTARAAVAGAKARGLIVSDRSRRGLYQLTEAGRCAIQGAGP